MKKQRISYWLLVMFLLIAAITGTVFAYMFNRTEYKDNHFTPANVSCVVHEKTDNDSDVSNITQKTSITVENTGNIPAYIRVRLVSYWVKVTGDGNAEVMGKASEIPKISSEKLGIGWIPGENDTYYYKSPVEPGKQTGTLFSSTEVDPGIILAEKDGCLQVIEVFAEAIQSKPGNAVTSSWPVTLDFEGYIATAN